MSTFRLIAALMFAALLLSAILLIGTLIVGLGVLGVGWVFSHLSALSQYQATFVALGTSVVLLIMLYITVHAIEEETGERLEESELPLSERPRRSDERGRPRY